MQTKTNFVVDFETLACRPNAVVRCLSIIPFTLEREETIEELLSRELTVWFDPATQIESGRELDEDTLEFWQRKEQMAQAGEERANAEAILGTHPDDMHPAEALQVIADGRA